MKIPTLLGVCIFVLFQRYGTTRRYHKTRLLIHLIGGDNKYEGYLGVYANQKWSYICNAFWDVRNSKVVCRELGYSKVAPILSARNLTNDVEDRDFLHYEITCEGNELELGKCAQKNIQPRLRESKCGLQSRVIIRCSATKDNDVIKPSVKFKAHSLRMYSDDDNGNYITSGRLQVYSKDTWTDFCPEYWNEINSRIACLQLGFPTLESFHSSSPSGNSGKYIYKFINCTGKESIVEECPSWSLAQSCDSGNVVVLKCKLPNKNDVIQEKNGELRLRGGDTDGSGRVEIFRNKRWGTVCDDGWDLRDANVVCQELGFGSAYEATHWAEHGEGLGKILMTNVKCYGNETNLKNCKSSPNTRECTHSEDAGVRCHMPVHSHQKRLKLVGGSEKSGRLEVIEKGEWFGICGIGFTQREGTVACRQLGLGFVRWAGRSYSYGINYRKIMYDVQCYGNETSLFECKYKSYSQCRYYDMASVICSTHAPDLLMDIHLFKNSIKVESHTLYELRCSYEERCLAPIVDSYFAREKHRKRHLLKFTSRFVNKGTINFRPNTDKKRWNYHQCHDHYHSMETFAQYDIIDESGTRVADGHKASFCLEDSDCESGHKKVFNCTNKGDQGISVNCADNYKNTIDCQWIDITELHYGNYSLRVEVNPLRNVAESDWLNNKAVCEVEYYKNTIKVKECSNDPCFQESFGGNSFGHCCHFPFVYNSELHYACVKENDDRSWCSTTVDYDTNRKWGYCSERK